MKHDQHFQELLWLYFYNELSDSERAAFQTHLDECLICQAELKRLQAVEKQIDRAPAQAPTPQLLAEMNQRVMLEITGSGRRIIIDRIKEFFEELYETVTLTMARPRYQLIVAGLTFVIGMFVGKLWLSTGLRHNPEMLANLVNYNYQLTEPEKDDMQKAFAGYLLKSGGIEGTDISQVGRNDNGGGLLEVNVKVEKNLAVRGGLDDPTIRSMLMYSARQEQSPERRRRAVRLLGQVESCLEIDATLVAVMLNDPVEANRLLACQLLDDRPITEQRLEAYKSVALHDSSAVIRKLALKNLVRQSSPDIVPVIALIAARDKDEEIRSLARNALDELYAINNEEKK